jgi:hypothetical protein
VHDLGVRVLEHETDPAAHGAQVGAGVQAVDQHPARGGQHQAVEQPGQRALPRPVAADHPDPVLGQGQRQVAQHLPLAVGVADPAQLDPGPGQRRGHRGGRAPPSPAGHRRAAVGTVSP